MNIYTTLNKAILKTNISTDSGVNRFFIDIVYTEFIFARLYLELLKESIVFHA